MALAAKVVLAAVGATAAVGAKGVEEMVGSAVTAAVTADVVAQDRSPAPDEKMCKHRCR